MKVYRNVFFTKSGFKNGSGSVDVYYYGQLYINAKSIKNLNSMYDKKLDLVIGCSDCASRKYRNFIHVNKV